jgi:hypothetical protein
MVTMVSHSSSKKYKEVCTMSTTQNMDGPSLSHVSTHQGPFTVESTQGAPIMQVQSHHFIGCPRKIDPKQVPSPHPR